MRIVLTICSMPGEVRWPKCALGWPKSTNTRTVQSQCASFRASKGSKSTDNGEINVIIRACAYSRRDPPRHHGPPTL